ncbi:TPA: hypothetical protein ACGBG5_002537 [Enterococcus faecalis]
MEDMMGISLHRKGLGEVILFSLPAVICIIGTIISICVNDFDYLVKCVIAGYPFIGLFVWRLCAYVYYRNLTKLIEKENE